MIDSDKLSIKHAYEWLDQNSRPSLELLYDLADRGTPESLQLLYELAEEYDINTAGNPDLRTLAEKIYTASNDD